MKQITSFSGINSFLSNFYTSKVEFEGMEFWTVEHAFQAAKTTDMSARRAIQEASTPGKAKRLGRKVALRPDWEDIKIDVMKELVTKKFEDDDLAFMLIRTGDAELIEGNHWGDTFWGVCDGVGQNNLGKILMEVRENVKEA